MAIGCRRLKRKLQKVQGIVSVTIGRFEFKKSPSSACARPTSRECFIELHAAYVPNLISRTFYNENKFNLFSIHELYTLGYVRTCEFLRTLETCEKHEA